MKRHPSGAAMPWSARFILGGGVVAAIGLVSAPLLLLLTSAFRGPGDRLPFEAESIWTLEHLKAIFENAALYTVTARDTLLFVSGAIALTFVIAFGLAWLVERTDLPNRSLVFALVLVPMLVPAVMFGIAWIQLFGPNAGWVNVAVRWAIGGDVGPFDVFTLPGLITCQTVVLVPLAFVLLSATLRTMNPALEEASSVAGASPLVTFRRITWAVLRPGILAPLMLVLLVALEQFDLPLMIGVPARVDVFSTRIFYELNPDSGLPLYGRAAAAAFPFLIIGAVLLALYNHLVRQADRYVTISSRGYRSTRYPLRRWRGPAVVLVWLYLGVATLLPVIALVGTSIVGNVPLSSTMLQHASIDAYRNVLSNPTFTRAVGNTLIVAILSATLVTTVGVLLAWVIVRTHVRGRRFIDGLSIVSIAIPSVIAALATMIMYLSVPIPVYGTIWILVLAYSYRIAISTRVCRSGLMQISRDLEHASAVSGGRWGATFRRIVLPLMTPSLAASFVLLFIVGVREFTVPLVLGSRENIVVGVMLWRLFEDGHAPEAAAVATMLVACMTPLGLFARRAAA